MLLVEKLRLTEVRRLRRLLRLRDTRHRFKLVYWLGRFCLLTTHHNIRDGVRSDHLFRSFLGHRKRDIWLYDILRCDSRGSSCWLFLLCCRRSFFDSVFPSLLVGFELLSLVLLELHAGEEASFGQPFHALLLFSEHWRLRGLFPCGALPMAAAVTGAPLVAGVIVAVAVVIVVVLVPRRV